MQKHLDIIIYVLLMVLAVAATAQIGFTCEEIGCLAIFLPIMAMMFLTAAEFIINLVFLIRGHRFSLFRSIIFALTTMGTLLSAGFILYTSLQ